MLGRNEGFQVDELVGAATLAVRVADEIGVYPGGAVGVMGPGACGARGFMGAHYGRGVSVCILGCRHWRPIPNASKSGGHAFVVRAMSQASS
jgi:hypothetical protein